MRIILKGADFSNSNIGTLTTWLISKSLKGYTVNNTSTSVEKDGEYVATFTVTEGYVYSSAIVTMGGVDITNLLSWNTEHTVGTLTISKVTGDVSIKIIGTLIEGEEPTLYTFTINPSPSDATVVLTASGYTQSGNSISVPGNTNVSWVVSKSGYTEQSGNQVVTKNETISIELVEKVESNVSGWILAEQSGVPHEDLVLSSMLGTQYFVFDDSASHFSGKTIDKVWFAVQPSKETKFNVEVFLVDLNNTLPTAWELKETIAVPANSGGQKLTNTLTTPITVPAGYTIGVHASLSSISSVTKDSINSKSLAAHYYNNSSATSSSTIGLMSYDFHVQ